MPPKRLDLAVGDAYQLALTCIQRADKVRTAERARTAFAVTPGTEDMLILAGTVLACTFWLFSVFLVVRAVFKGV